jgi:hypothetical protein
MNDERGKVWIGLRRSFNSSVIIHHLSFLLCYAVDRLPPRRYDEEAAGGNRRKARRLGQKSHESNLDEFHL